MSTDKLKTVWNACSSCDRDTRHDILFSAEESEYEYRIDYSHQVVSCRGCETKSFRKVVAYIEEAFQIDDDEWEVPKDIILFPAVLKGHRTVPDITRAPRIVRGIYQQSIQAIKNQANTLAGIGLRATIEAICNERSVPGRTLEARIDKLSKLGFVSQADADRLHAIRFMGNDAAHEIQPSELESLLIALKIVEHLIVSLYILDKDADGVLETLLKTYSLFEPLLKQKLTTLGVGDEEPLFKILGRDTRRFHGYLKSHETQLISNIASGAFTELKLGKLDVYATSKEKFQHYIKA
jgi:hypothetical protein